MLNKRLLIKNLLAQNDESSFFDKKRQLNLHSREGKAKFLKHICALSNSNPVNNSYIVVGVEDQDNEIVGEDFFDDSTIQNLVNAYLENPPKIQYDNVPFPHLPKDKVVGLVTVKPKKKVSFFKKGIYTIPIKSVFIRIGSTTTPIEQEVEKNTQNQNTIFELEKNSRNNIEHTLDSVFEFTNYSHKDMHSQYKVFKELFVICWAGIPKKIRNTTYLSRVDIELINEQIKLFYSSQDVVTIAYDAHSFTITEYLPLGLNEPTSYYPFEQQTIYFYENGYYKIENKMLFEPPVFNKKMLQRIYARNLALLEKLSNQNPLTEAEKKDLKKLPFTFMICYLNGFEDAKQQLIAAKMVLKPYPDCYILFKEALRVLRKMKYNQA